MRPASAIPPGPRAAADMRPIGCRSGTGPVSAQRADVSGPGLPGIATRCRGNSNNQNSNTYSTVTLFARFRGLSTSVPRITAVW
jgi:hypothetical protein